MVNATLTEEQKKFIEECESEFKDRYTEQDSEYMKIKNAERKKPPIVDPWYAKNRRSSAPWARHNDGENRRNQHWERRNQDRYRPQRSYRPY